MCKTIKQKVHFKAPPEVIYGLLTDSKKYATLTGKKAKIGKSAGAAFSVYGGQATGIIVELVKNRRIVQAWRGHSFPEGIFSMATFNLKPVGKNGTELILIHRGVPKEMIPSIENGWRKYNWDKIKTYLENQR
ncbi:SRPBCC domain-containing protein [Bdellovibrio sp. SKB1291214]|uniref:SRPBCC domain-containing protein n=1 Tax=Bdellovibrio sp. SKB1291214 TaxID=1732569 RepID=UPI000B515577|nr:SRPBCC domain-containing protein [Bdellovibrio sp. SKB1291214]UYL10288.1 SRPBCC domain-containing protein [Bdellovibrio sp. SKB1291214]